MVYNEILNNIYFIGDIHGEFQAIKIPNLSDAIVIVCGDCGFGFHKNQYYTDIFPKLNKHCIKHNIKVYMFRGNHDDPSYFDGEKIKYSNIIAIPDYSVIVTPNHNILCVGGAISVDRTWRLGCLTWNINSYSFFHNCSKAEAEQQVIKGYWEDEPPVYKEEKLDKILEQYNIDIIATHTAPNYAFPRNDIYAKPGLERWLQKDENLSEDLDYERGVMDKIYKKVQPKYWFYGHFHDHWVENYNNTRFYLLNMYTNGKVDAGTITE